MKKALLSLLLAIACMPMAFGQNKAGNLVTTDTTVCGQFRWVDGVTYTTDTAVLYVDTASNTTYVLNLTMLPPVYDTTNAIPLEGVCSVSWNQHEWKTPGTFIDTLVASNGCDSIVKVEITLGGIDTINETLTRCGYYVAPWGDTLSSSVVYTDQSIAAEHCSYFVNLDLTINPVEIMPTEEIASAGCSYTWNGMTITDTALHTLTLHTVFGCDSILSVRVLNLTHEEFDTIDVTACDEYVFFGDTLTHDTVCTHIDTTTACHSVVTLNLTVINSFRDTTATPVLDVTGGCRIYWLGETYTYEDTNRVVYGMGTTTVGGCDSLMAIHIVGFDSIQHDTTFVENCGKYHWAVTNANYDSTDIYTYSYYDSVALCAENKHLALTIIANYDTVRRDSCAHCTYVFDARSGIAGARDRAYFDVSGIYTADTAGEPLYSKHMSTGCITYHTLVLNIKDVEQRHRSFDIDTIACDKFEFKFNGRKITYTEDVDTTLVQGYRTYKNCYDSIGNIKVQINRKSYRDYHETVCDSYYWPFTGETYTSSTTQTKVLDSIKNVQGCDSIGRLNLTINYTPVVSITGNWHLHTDSSNVATLKVVDDPADHNTYKWFRDNSVTPFSTSDSVSFTVDANTDIRLEATSNKNCTATNWITVTYTTGIDEVESLNVNLYPNPASRFLNVESAEGISEVVIYNAIGQQVIVRRDINATNAQLDLGALATGHYTMQIRSINGEQATRKFIVNK